MQSNKQKIYLICKLNKFFKIFKEKLYLNLPKVSSGSSKA